MRLEVISIQTNISFCESEDLCETSHRRALKRHTICGNRPGIDTKPHLSYTEPYQKLITHPFIYQLDLSLDLEGINNEVPKVPDRKPR